jgi:putative transposase
VEYRKSSHSVFKIHLHLVWITKYRKAVLTGDPATRCREIIQRVCAEQDVEIIQRHVSKDHVHLFVSIPASLAASKPMQRIKGASGRMLLRECPSLRKKYWGGHLWARGYFCCSSGNITDEMIIEYIEQQDQEENPKFTVAESSDFQSQKEPTG